MDDLTFFTNEQGKSLAERFSKILINNTKYLDVLVGYFRASGFYEVYQALEKTEKIRILVGINVDKKIASMYSLAQGGDNIVLSNKDVKNITTDKVIDEMNNSEDSLKVEEGIKKFIELIQNGKLEVRVYPRDKIHAKVYIMRKDLEKSEDFGKVVTGSSNFSYSGLKGNLEFNVELKDRRDVEYALEKFEELWKEGVEISKEYIETITQKTWINDEITPYELYLKFLYEYFYEEINADMREFKGEFLPDGFTKFQYQIDAVNQAKKILNKYNGVFLADVVGLGKTYITALLARELKHGRSLVICPPVLQDYWKRVLEDFGVSATVVSLGKLDKIIDEYPNDYFRHIFIDEAHRFRNSATSNYTKLHQICVDKKVVLISATPQNNYSSDLLNLISLFQQRNNSNVIEDNPDIEDFFKKLDTKEKKAIKLHKDANTEASREKLDRIIDENSNAIRDKVLRKIMVRRVRSEIKKYYKDDMEKQGLVFPELGTPEQIIYSFDEKMDAIFENILTLITSLNYSRYKSLTYLKNPDSDTRTLLVGQMNMKGFMKALLLKRLESSFFAFSNTVKRFKESYEKFLEMYNEGVIYISKKYNVYDLLADENDEKLMRLVEEEEIERFLVEEFDDKFKRDLESDLQVLRSIYLEIEKITVDPKLDYFIKELKTNSILKGTKKIIFTESQETANYLKEKLKEALNEPIIEFTGSSNISLKDRIRANYDPNYEKSKEDRYNILITTDVLAEGINLHRANVLINYDLPWNPTRIMQRVGRINRVGTKFDKIYVFNFFPTSKSNEHLGLRDNITSKINSFQKTLGDDFKYLTEDEVVGGHELSGELLYSQLNKRLDVEDEWEESELEYLKEIREIRDRDEDLFVKIKELPKKSRSSKYDSTIEKPSVISFIRDGELKRVYITDQDINTRELTFFEAVKHIKCKMEEAKIPMGDDFYELLKCNKYYFTESKEKNIIQTPQKKAGKDAEFLKLVKALDSYRKFSGDEEKKVKKIKELGEAGIIPKDILKKIVNEANDVMKRDSNPHKILEHVFNEIPDVYRETKKKNIDITTGNVEVILSEYLA
ncbi:MAG: helicase-related protein [Cetobacterium sp.]|uniref:helicase-related protein n=1 Tax=Cetobacterium sp. TaxID=2071632 RepID=UPI003F382EEE